MRHSRIIVVCVAVALLGGGLIGYRLGLFDTGPALTMTPLGRRVTEAARPASFMVALTNKTSFARNCVVGRTEIFPYGTGYTTNFMSHQLVRIAPWSGTVVAVAPPTNAGAWFLSMTHRRVINPSELKLRNMAVQLKLLKPLKVVPNWGLIERIEVESEAVTNALRKTAREALTNTPQVP